MADYYIDASWTGTQSGTESEPYTYINQATNYCDSNSTIYLRAGTHYGMDPADWSVNKWIQIEAGSGDNVTIKPYPGEVATISHPTSEIRLYRDGWTWEDLIFDFSQPVRVGSAVTDIARNTTFRRCTFRNSPPGYTGGIKWNTGDGLTIEDCIFDNLRRRRAGVDGSALAVGVVLHNSLRTTNNLVLTGCQFTDIGSDCVEVQEAGGFDTYLDAAITFSFSGNTITRATGTAALNADANLVAGIRLKIKNSLYNDGIVTVASVTATTIVVEESLTAESAVAATVCINDKENWLIENNSFKINLPYTYRDSYGTEHTTPPTYHLFNTDAYAFDLAAKTITRTSGTDDLSVFEAGSCIAITGGSNNLKFVTVSDVTAPTASVITVLEPTLITGSDTAGVVTLKSFDGSRCGENGIDWKGFTGSTSDNTACITRNNVCENLRDDTSNQDVSGSNGLGMVIHFRVWGVVVENNLLLNNNKGWSVSAPHGNNLYDIHVRNNIFADGQNYHLPYLNSTVTIAFNSCFDTHFYNNVVVDLNYDAAEEARFVFTMEENTFDTNVEIYNNIFMNGRISDQTAGAVNATFRNNCWYNLKDTVPAAFVSAEDITIDPQLDNDYKLQGDSPCIGAGVAALSLTDYNGDTRKSLAGFDIGAVWFDGPSDTTVERLLASGGTK